MNYELWIIKTYKISPNGLLPNAFRCFYTHGAYYGHTTKLKALSNVQSPAWEEVVNNTWIIGRLVNGNYR